MTKLEFINLTEKLMLEQGGACFGEGKYYAYRHMDRGCAIGVHLSREICDALARNTILSRPLADAVYVYPPMLYFLLALVPGAFLDFFVDVQDMHDSYRSGHGAWTYHIRTKADELRTKYADAPINAPATPEPELTYA